MSDQFGTRDGDWAAAYQRQTFVTGKAGPPSHWEEAPLISRSFSPR